MLRTFFAALAALVIVSTTARAEPDLDRYFPSASTFHAAKQHAAKRPRWHQRHRVARQMAPRPRPGAHQRVVAREVPLPRPRPADAPVPTATAEVLAELGRYMVEPDMEAPSGPGAAFLFGLAEFRAFIVRTATAGGTMVRQGRDKAVECLHPRFAERLAGAIREARLSGLPRAGVYSACRPPGFGVGGFRDKFMSMHAYGLAVDMAGIGRPGSRESKLWNVIATRHKLYNPYFGRKAHEWNHYQPTSIKLVMARPPVVKHRKLAKKKPAKVDPLTAAVYDLRDTMTARGPVNLERMWKVAEALLDREFSAAKKIKRKVRSRYAHRRGWIRYARRL